MTKKFSKLCAFGDSYSDNGFSDGYGFKRYSDTYTWVEYLAQMLDIPLLDCAHAGALTGEGNYNGLNWSGMAWQIKKFFADSYKQCDMPTTLFTVLCSINDIAEGTYSSEESAENIVFAVETLAQNGARSILYREHSVILKYPGLYAPEYADKDEALAEKLNEINIMANNKLDGYIKTKFPDLKIIQISNDDLFTKVRDGAPGFKFENITEPCPDEGGCQNPFSYAWYDNWHPGGAMHRLMAEESYAALAAAKML